VQWRGYPHWEATWEPTSNLSGALDAIADFEAAASEDLARS
jgi:hypothetical protein